MNSAAGGDENINTDRLPNIKTRNIIYRITSTRHYYSDDGWNS